MCDINVCGPKPVLSELGGVRNEPLNCYFLLCYLVLLYGVKNLPSSSAALWKKAFNTTPSQGPQGLNSQQMTNQLGKLIILKIQNMAEDFFCVFESINIQYFFYFIY